WLAGPPLPVPHGVGLAATVAAALAADLLTRHQSRILRIRSPPPYRARCVLRAVRGRRQVDAVLSRGVRALRLGADAGTDALPSEYSSRRDRRRSPGTLGDAAQGTGTLPDAGWSARRPPQARLAQCRGRAADPARRRRIADLVLRQPRHGRRADQTLPRGGRRRGARSRLSEPRRPRYRTPDALAQTILPKSAAANSRSLRASDRESLIF